MQVPRFLSILIVALFSFSILAIYLHSHSDQEDHSSCSFCMLLQDLSTLENAGHFELSPSQSLIEGVFIIESYDAYSQFHSIAKNSRSPPV
jgi:hypothetical protein